MRVPGIGWRFAVLVGVTTLIFLRVQDAFFLPQFRAEDGTHFFTQARRLGLESLGETCNGYHVLFGRLVALAASFAPPEIGPRIYTTAALLAMLGVAMFASSARVGFRWPALAALALALVPGLGGVYLHLTDAQTVLAAGLGLLLIAGEPRTRAQLVCDLAFCAVAGLTGPHALVLLPLFVWRAAARRSRASFAMLGVLLLVAAIQARALIGDSRLSGEFDATRSDWLAAVGLRIAGVMLPGEAWVRSPSPAWLAGASVLLVAFLFVASWRARDARPAVLTAAAVLVLAAVCFAFRDAPRFLVVTPGDQYSYLPLLFLVWALLELAAGRGPAARVSQGLLCVCVIATVTDFRREPLPDRHWSQLAAHVGGDIDCNIPIHPGRNLWYVQYRTAAEGRAPPPDVLARIVAEALPAKPSRIDAQPAAAQLTFHQGNGYLDVPLSARLVYDLPSDERRFEIRVGLRPLPGAGDDTIEFRLDLEPTDGGDTRILRRLPIRPMSDLLPALDDPDELILTMDAELPRRAGRLVVHARSTAPDSAWRILWGGARFTDER